MREKTTSQDDNHSQWDLKGKWWFAYKAIAQMKSATQWPLVNHSDKVNIITKVYGDKINTNFDSIVNQFGSDGALYALILAQ